MRVAYLSPLPPQRSGIADYSAELLPELARHLEIEHGAVVARAHDDPIVPGQGSGQAADQFEFVDACHRM